eukprot:scaffold1941_cov377-Prasinococcus_capsulatus_cf.AAC.7
MDGWIRCAALVTHPSVARASSASCIHPCMEGWMDSLRGPARPGPRRGAVASWRWDRARAAPSPVCRALVAAHAVRDTGACAALLSALVTGGRPRRTVSIIHQPAARPGSREAHAAAARTTRAVAPVLERQNTSGCATPSGRSERPPLGGPRAAEEGGPRGTLRTPLG